MDERELTAHLKQEGEIVTERLDHWAAVAGDRVFIYYGEDDEALTFAEFARRADAIAGNLVRLGIRKGDRVSIARIARHRLYAARRPDYRIMPTTVRAYGVAECGTLSTNEA